MVICVANITLSIPDEFKKRMDEHPEIRWSAAVRNVLEQKLDDLQELDAILKSSQLTQADARALADKVNQKGAKHAEALIRETSS